MATAQVAKTLRGVVKKRTEASKFRLAEAAGT